MFGTSLLRQPGLWLSTLLTICAVHPEAWGQTASDNTDGTVLRLLNWSEYMDPDLLDAFQQETGIRVEELYFENDLARDQMVLETDGGRGFDLFVLDDQILPFYIERGWLARLERDQIPNLSNIDPHWRTLGPQFEDYAVPYFWGTLGVAYRADLIAEPITAWRQLLEPTEELRGRIVMLTDPYDLVGSALFALGHAYNTGVDAELAAAAALLDRQRPHLYAYGYVALTEDADLVTGDVYAATMYSGEALYLQQYNEHIRYVIPEEGSRIWVDYIAVAAASDQKEAAMRFVDFLNEPENAVQLAQYVYFASPNMAAEALLPDEFLADPVIYPPADVLERCVFYDAAMPAAAIRARTEIVADLTRQR